MGPNFGRLGDRVGWSLAVTSCAHAITAACSAAPPIAADDTPRTPGRLEVSRPADKGTSPVDVANPVRLRIPAIGVSTSVIALGLDSKGGLVAPKAFDRVGWNKAGPEPGEPGAAVIAGHVDSKAGPAVFYRLRNLRAGDVIHVDRADGSTARFTVSRLARYPKDRIPDEEVYGSAKGVHLRLITCGGAFDRERRSYRDNIVVFSALR